MLIEELKKLEEQMPKTFVQIVLNQYDTILALREKRYKLIAIYNALQKENIFPPNLTYIRFKDIWGIENRRRGRSKQTHDTKKGEVTAAQIPSPTPEIKHTEVTEKDISTSAPSTDKTPHTEQATTNLNMFGMPTMTEEERKAWREKQERERKRRDELRKADKVKEAMEKYGPGRTMRDPSDSAKFIVIPDDADEKYYRNLLYPEAPDE